MPVSMPDKGYEYLEHTADAKFRAYGTTLEKAFQNAAVAMFNVMINTDTISDKVSEKIELTSEDLDGLLVDWLAELLYLFEVEQIVFGNFKVNAITEKDGNYSLSALAYGEPLDLSHHNFDTEIKAVTYNSLEVEKTADSWVVQVVVDT